MGVLPAVLPHPGDVALDVAGIGGRSIERRIEELDQAVLAAHQVTIERLHGGARALRAAGAGQHRPALRDRIDAAFGVAGGAERRAVVEVRAPVPLAVPAVLLDARTQRSRLVEAALGEGHLAAAARERGEALEHVVAEEGEPDALPFALRADLVHAVVPVARADQRQPMPADAGAALDGSHAVLVQARAFA